MEIELIIAMPLFAIAVIIFSTLVLGTIFSKKIGHDILGWHDCDIEGNDGCSNAETKKSDSSIINFKNMDIERKH